MISCIASLIGKNGFWGENLAQLPPAPISIPLAIAALAVLAMLILRLTRLPSDLRARKQPTLDPDQVDGLMMGDPPQVIDLRAREAFYSKEGHLRGAVSMPASEFEARIQELDTSHPRPIVLVDESDKFSHLFVPLLVARGHQWVYVLRGGMRAWRRAKLPLYQAKETRLPK